MSCTTHFPVGGVEFATSPPDLRRIPKEQIQSSMWVLAAEIENLEALLADPRPRDEERRRQIGFTLERMEVAARAIDQPGRSSQHPMLDRFMPRFIERLERAQQGARRDPPNYYLAGTVAGACFLCHSSSQTAASIFDERTSSAVAARTTPRRSMR